MENTTVERWKETFSKIEEESKQAGENIVWVLVDGFLLYWNKVSWKPSSFTYVSNSVAGF